VLTRDGLTKGNTWKKKQERIIKEEKFSRREGLVGSKKRVNTMERGLNRKRNHGEAGAARIKITIESLAY